MLVGLAAWAATSVAPLHADPAASQGGEAELIGKEIYDAENLAFDRHGRLYVSAADRLYVFVPADPQGRSYTRHHLIDLKAIFAGMALGPDGCLYVACYQRMKTRILRVEITREGYPHNVYFDGGIRAPNGLRFDDRGNLYAADFGFYAPGSGKLLRIEPDPEDPTVAGRTTTVLDGLWGPNGIVVDRDRGRLYFSETFSGKVRYLRRNDDGDFAGEPALLLDVAMPGPRFAIVDDLTLDAAGNLYVCHYNGNRILVVSPAGEVLRTLTYEGMKHPTALAFGVLKGDRSNLSVTEKGHMFFRESRAGDRLTRLRDVAAPYVLPFLAPPGPATP